MRLTPRRPRASVLAATFLLTVALAAVARAQVSPPLVEVADGVAAAVGRSERGWSRETLPPPISGRNFIIDFYRLGGRYVKVVLWPGYSPEEAEFGLDTFAARVRWESRAKLEGLGDEGYLWGNPPDHKNVTFRKGNVLVYMTGRLESDARRFAYAVASALPAGDRVGLVECGPERAPAAPSALVRRWAEASPEGGGFRVLLPCDAEALSTEKGGSFRRDVRTRRGHVSYHVGYTALSPDEAERLRSLYAEDEAGPRRTTLADAKVISRRRFVKDGFPAVEHVEGSAAEGFSRRLSVVTGTHAYTLMASSSSESMLRSAEVEEFFRSFKING